MKTIRCILWGHKNLVINVIFHIMQWAANAGHIFTIQGPGDDVDRTYNLLISANIYIIFQMKLLFKSNRFVPKTC